MKTATLIVLLAFMHGCASMTPTEKKVVSITAGVLVLGAIAAHNVDHGGSMPSSAAVGPPMSCTPQPNGSCR